MTVSVDIHNSGIASTYNLTAHLQAADIATLNSVPITLVATPGPNTAIVVVSTSLEYKPGTGTWAAPYGGVAWGSLPTDNTLAQAVKIATKGKVDIRTGGMLELHADTICVHGDRPDAAVFAQRLRQSFESAGVRVAKV